MRLERAPDFSTEMRAGIVVPGRKLVLGLHHIGWFGAQNSDAPAWVLDCADVAVESGNVVRRVASSAQPIRFAASHEFIYCICDAQMHVVAIDDLLKAPPLDPVNKETQREKIPAPVRTHPFQPPTPNAAQFLTSAARLSPCGARLFVLGASDPLSALGVFVDTASLSIVAATDIPCNPDAYSEWASSLAPFFGADGRHVICFQDNIENRCAQYHFAAILDATAPGCPVVQLLDTGAFVSSAAFVASSTRLAVHMSSESSDDQQSFRVVNTVLAGTREHAVAPVLRDQCSASAFIPVDGPSSVCCHVAVMGVAAERGQGVTLLEMRNDGPPLRELCHLDWTHPEVYGFKLEPRASPNWDEPVLFTINADQSVSAFNIVHD
jgi:hypothetical protein